MALYPRHVHQRGGVYQIVTDEAAHTAALEAGWRDHPPLDWPHVDVYLEWDGTPVTVAPITAPKRPKAPKPSKAQPPSES